MSDEILKQQARDIDTMAKILLSHKDVIANILKYTVKEFENYSIKEIMSFLSDEPEINETEVDDNFLPKIDAAGSEAVSSNDGRRTYDIKFKVRIPGKEDIEEIELIINIEAQNDFTPGYKLEYRAIYYICRMISSQYGTEFVKSDFNKLKKVYSIWICLNSPKEYANTITRYSLKPENIVGNAPDRPEKYDLISLVMINLGDTYENYDGLIKMLDVLLKKFFDDRNALTKEFENEYNLNLSDIYKEVDSMNIGQGTIDRWMLESEKRGEAKKEAEILRNLRNMGMTEEQIKTALGDNSNVVWKES